MECDALCRAVPGIYAAGEVASWHNPHFGTRMRLEHRINATQQAMVAVGNLLGDAKPFAPVPYFWTDQYDTRIQAYGVLGWNAPPPGTHAASPGRRTRVGDGLHGRTRAPPGNREPTPGHTAVASG
ncbi:hypothetical protein ACFYRG_29190 [Streptomyces mirabilis]|uniref:hypothetical protein n=1 Tax=Streptomyces mirabilis TaxID=68239 RepID=UPI00368AAD9F